MLSQAAAQVVAHNEITYNKITYNEIKYNEIALLCHCLDSVCLLLETWKEAVCGGPGGGKWRTCAKGHY